MDYLPLFLDVKNRPFLIVGGGAIAARKVGILQRAKATITIVSPTLIEAFQEKVNKEAPIFGRKHLFQQIKFLYMARYYYA